MKMENKVISTEQRLDLIYQVNDVIWQCHIMTENLTTDCEIDYLKSKASMLETDLKRFKNTLTKIQENK